MLTDEGGFGLGGAVKHLGVSCWYLALVMGGSNPTLHSLWVLYNRLGCRSMSLEHLKFAFYFLVVAHPNVLIHCVTGRSCAARAKNIESLQSRFAKVVLVCLCVCQVCVCVCV